MFHRNNLNKILMTVQSPQDEWTVDACCYCPGSGSNPPEPAGADDRSVAAGDGSRGTTTIPDAGSGGSGTLFLDIVKTPQRDYPNSDLFCYYGYKFEAVCTVAIGGEGGGGGGNNGNVPQGAATADMVDSSSEFALLLRLKLGAHSILMAAEVDCVEPEGEAAAAAGEKGSKEGEAAAAAAASANLQAVLLLEPRLFMELKTVKWV